MLARLLEYYGFAIKLHSAELNAAICGDVALVIILLLQAHRALHLGVGRNVLLRIELAHAITGIRDEIVCGVVGVVR